MSYLQVKKSTSVEFFKSSRIIYCPTNDPGVSPGCCLPKIIKAFLSYLISVLVVLILIMGIDLPIMVVPIEEIETLGWSLMVSMSFLRSLRS